MLDPKDSMGWGMTATPQSPNVGVALRVRQPVDRVGLQSSPSDDPESENSMGRGVTSAPLSPGIEMDARLPVSPMRSRGVRGVAEGSISSCDKR